MKLKVMPAPKVKPQLVTYEVVLDDNVAQFRKKAEDLISRNFCPHGNLVLVVYQDKLFVGQAFVRSIQYGTI